MLVLNDQHGHEVIDRQSAQLFAIGADSIQNFPLAGFQFARHAVFELLLQHRYPFVATSSMSNRKIDGNLPGVRTIFEKHLYRITNIALLRVKIVFCKVLCFP